MFQVALRRQQTSQDSKGMMDVTKAHSTMETLLAQKRVYQKHLRNMQQSSLAQNILQGTCYYNRNYSKQTTYYYKSEYI